MARMTVHAIFIEAASRDVPYEDALAAYAAKSTNCSEKTTVRAGGFSDEGAESGAAPSASAVGPSGSRPLKPDQGVDHVRRVGDGFDAVWPLVASIDGWLSREQAAALYEAAGTVASGTWIVEIGSHHGRSTVALAKGKASSVDLLAIDPFFDPPYGHGDTAFKAFLGNMERLGLEADVTLFRGTSAEAAKYPDSVFGLEGGEVPCHVSKQGGVTVWTCTANEPAIGLLFVDGRHDRNSVLQDIDLWEPFIVEGGLVYFHDAFFRVGVTLALLERHFLNSWFSYLGSVGNLAMFRRERVVGNKDALRGSLKLLARLGYFGRNMLTTLALRKNWSTLVKLLPPEEDFEY